jgi:protein transport protein SEC31
MAPNWFGKRVGSSFGFGGKMVSWGSVDKKLEIKQIITEAKVVDESKKLLVALESDVETYCNDKLESVETDIDENIWKFIRARCAENQNEKFIELLTGSANDAPPAQEVCIFGIF